MYKSFVTTPKHEEKASMALLMGNCSLCFIGEIGKSELDTPFIENYARVVSKFMF